MWSTGGWHAHRSGSSSTSRRSAASPGTSVKRDSRGGPPTTRCAISSPPSCPCARAASWGPSITSFPRGSPARPRRVTSSWRPGSGTPTTSSPSSSAIGAGLTTTRGQPPRTCSASLTASTSGATPPSADRFSYLYSAAELGEWVPSIREAARRGTTVHVLLNNNRSNYAVVNAFDFGALLDVALPRPPQPIVDRLVERDAAVPAWVAEGTAPPPWDSSPMPASTPDAAQGTLDLST